MSRKVGTVRTQIRRVFFFWGGGGGGGGGYLGSEDLVSGAAQR